MRSSRKRSQGKARKEANTKSQPSHPTSEASVGETSPVLASKDIEGALLLFNTALDSYKNDDHEAAILLGAIRNLLHAIQVNPITNRRRKLDMQGRILGHLAYTCNLDERLVAGMSKDLGVVCTKPKMTYELGRAQHPTYETGRAQHPTYEDGRAQHPTYEDGRKQHREYRVRCYACKELKELTSLMVCSGCRVNKYCSRECQVAHWPEHSKSCRTSKPKPKSSLETGRAQQRNKSGKKSLTNQQIVDHLIENVDLQYLNDYGGQTFVFDYCSANNITYSRGRWPHTNLLLTAAIARASRRRGAAASAYLQRMNERRNNNK